MILLLLSMFAMAEDPEFEETVKEIEEVEKPQGEASAELGGSLVDGNTSFYQLNAKLSGGYKWQKNRVSAIADALWGKGFVDLDGSGTLEDVERSGSRVETARRFSAEARYDRFFSERDSLYLMAGALVDPFAGYDLRTHEQLGYSRTLITNETTSMLAEIGIDYAQENYVVDVDPNYMDVIAARQMVAFKHAFTESFAIEEMVEAYENILVIEDIRVNNTFTLSAKLSDKLALKASHSLRFDNQPVEGFRPTDQTVLVTLVASLFKTEPPPEPPPEVVADPCDCGETGAAEETTEAKTAPRENPAEAIDQQTPVPPPAGEAADDAAEAVEKEVSAPRDANEAEKKVTGDR